MNIRFKQLYGRLFCGFYRMGWRDVAGVGVDLYLEYKLVPSCEELQAIFDRLVAEGIPRVSGGVGRSGKYAIIVA